MKTKLFNKIRNVYEEIISFFKRKRGKLLHKHIKKQSKLKKDVVLGTIHKLSVKNLILGVKVITPKGVASIKALNANDWVTVSYGTGRGGDHKASKLYQYFVEVKDMISGVVNLYPLSYADYEYIHPNESDDMWIEGHITNKKYFQLTDQEREDREHLPIFNKSWEGPHILIKLEKKNIDLKLKKQKLVTIKK